MKALALTLSSLMLMTLLLAQAGASETRKHKETVEIPDFALRRVIAMQLEKPYDATIIAADMEKLPFFSLHTKESKI